MRADFETKTLRFSTLFERFWNKQALRSDNYSSKSHLLQQELQRLIGIYHIRKTSYCQEKTHLTSSCYDIEIFVIINVPLGSLNCVSFTGQKGP
jgi:hypothetical protein